MSPDLHDDSMKVSADGVGIFSYTSILGILNLGDSSLDGLETIKMCPLAHSFKLLSAISFAEES